MDIEIKISDDGFQAKDRLTDIPYNGPELYPPPPPQKKLKISQQNISYTVFIVDNVFSSVYSAYKRASYVLMLACWMSRYCTDVYSSMEP